MFFNQSYNAQNIVGQPGFDSGYWNGMSYNPDCLGNEMNCMGGWNNMGGWMNNIGMCSLGSGMNNMAYGMSSLGGGMNNVMGCGMNSAWSGMNCMGGMTNGKEDDIRNKNESNEKKKEEENKNNVQRGIKEEGKKKKGEGKKKKREFICAKCGTAVSSRQRLCSCEGEEGALHRVCAHCVDTGINEALAANADNALLCVLAMEEECDNTYDMDMLEELIPYKTMMKVKKALKMSRDNNKSEMSETSPPSSPPLSPPPPPPPLPFTSRSLAPSSSNNSFPSLHPSSQSPYSSSPLSSSSFTSTSYSFPIPPLPSSSSLVFPPPSINAPVSVKNKRFNLSDAAGQNRCFNGLCTYCARPVESVTLPSRPEIPRLDCRICKISFMMNQSTLLYEEKPFQSVD